MQIEALQLAGCFLLRPDFYEDARGGFFESYNQKALEDILGHPLEFVQDNHSISKKGTLRGLHFQAGIHAQAKLLRVLRGAVLDVVVDIRPDSPTYGQYMKVRLEGPGLSLLYIPRGMAHGFVAVEEDTHFHYKCDNYYNPESERGIHFADPYLSIDWEFDPHNLILSPKDQRLPFLKDLQL